ncbi:DUF4856 domain-containing protein [Reichenbachiella versicolor]|uniref:DUF4856 domain-containing protein n=1 Tax=Reichenbachiella versicolor TaxID=1821036 RepID=UPI000D6E5419|nr:DUF4856 domain-containing protein [Reichenbachiella versicolor]
MNYLNNSMMALLMALAIALVSCDEEEETSFETPATYSFERDGESTVSYKGQTTRLKMAAEIVDELINVEETKSADAIKAMFAHEQGAKNFTDTDLNDQKKNIKSKTAASTDLFGGSVNASIGGVFETYIDDQISTLNEITGAAKEGTPGEIIEGTETIRYVDGDGIEWNQVFTKSLIGAFTLDQIINHYASAGKLDAYQEDNDNGTLDGDANYTEMEHNWDEAFGYLYGLEADPTSPTLGTDDLLNKYLNTVDKKTAFTGLADDIYKAFITGRAAIVAKEYGIRNQQADILREKLSLVVGVMAVFYLETGKEMYQDEKFGAAFHDFSEGLGFLYSLQFTQNPSTGDPYFSAQQSKDFMDKLLAGENGLWNINSEDIEAMSKEIASAFGFTVDQAMN